jgi:hypothetical protein
VCPQTYDPTSLGEKKKIERERNRMEVDRLERIRIEGSGLGAR